MAATLALVLTTGLIVDDASVERCALKVASLYESQGARSTQWITDNRHEGFGNQMHIVLSNAILALAYGRQLIIRGPSVNSAFHRL